MIRRCEEEIHRCLVKRCERLTMVGLRRGRSRPNKYSERWLVGTWALSSFLASIITLLSLSYSLISIITCCFLWFGYHIICCCYYFFLHYLNHGLCTILFPFSYLLWNAKLEPGIYRKQLDYFHKVGVKFAYTQPFSDSTCGITFDTLFAHCSLPLKFKIKLT